MHTTIEGSLAQASVLMMAVLQAGCQISTQPKRNVVRITLVGII